MRDVVSKLVQGASWLSAILTCLATVWWAVIVAGGNYCWDAFAFALGVAMPLGGVTLVSAVVPSGILYFRTRQRRDGMSLLLAGCSLLVILTEAMLLNFIIPQRGE